MAAACEAWDKAATQLHERMAKAKRDNDERHMPQQRKVEVLQDTLRRLKKTEEAGAEAIRNAELELEESQRELYLPYRAGWLFRVSHGGVMLGLQDFAVERCCASLQISLLPGRLASGAQQAALLRIVLDASGGGEKGDRHVGHSISLRLERMRLERLAAGFSLIPGSLEVASLTIALRCVMSLTFAFGSDGRWVCSTSKLDLHSLRTEKGGGGHLMSDMLTRWLLEKLLPGWEPQAAERSWQRASERAPPTSHLRRLRAACAALSPRASPPPPSRSVMSKMILKRLPLELGKYLAEATEPCEFATELRVTGTPLSVMTARLPLLAGLPPSLDSLNAADQASLSQAAHALRVQPEELIGTLAALCTLQPPPEKERHPRKRHLPGWNGKEREHVAPVFPPGAGHTLSLLELTRSRLDLERDEYESDLTALHGAWVRVADLQAKELAAAAAATAVAEAAVSPTVAAASYARAFLPAAAARTAAPVGCQRGERHDMLTSASLPSRPSSVSFRPSVASQASSASTETGAAAVDKVLEALLVLAAKPAKWELSIDSHVEIGLHLDSAARHLVDRRMRMHGETEQEVKRVEGRLNTLLAKLKRNVRSAECAVFSRLEWERSHAGQTGRVHMRLERVELSGPVDVSANINRHAQLISTLGSLVTRKIAMLPHSQLLLDFQCPRRPDARRPELSAETLISATPIKEGDSSGSSPLVAACSPPSSKLAVGSLPAGVLAATLEPPTPSMPLPNALQAIARTRNRTASRQPIVLGRPAASGSAASLHEDSHSTVDRLVAESSMEWHQLSYRPEEGVDDDDESDEKMLTSLFQARVSDWECGVHLDLDALQEALSRGHRLPLLASLGSAGQPERMGTYPALDFQLTSSLQSPRRSMVTGRWDERQARDESRQRDEKRPEPYRSTRLLTDTDSARIDGSSASSCSIPSSCHAEPLTTASALAAPAPAVSGSAHASGEPLSTVAVSAFAPALPPSVSSDTPLLTDDSSGPATAEAERVPLSAYIDVGTWPSQFDVPLDDEDIDFDDDDDDEPGAGRPSAIRLSHSKTSPAPLAAAGTDFDVPPAGMCTGAADETSSERTAAPPMSTSTRGRAQTAKALDQPKQLSDQEEPRSQSSVGFEASVLDLASKSASAAGSNGDANGGNGGSNGGLASRSAPPRMSRHRRTNSEPVAPAVHLKQTFVLESGWLWKYSRRNRSWRRRWFVLRAEGQLRWFKSDVEASVTIAAEQAALRLAPSKAAAAELSGGAKGAKSKDKDALGESSARRKAVGLRGARLSLRPPTHGQPHVLLLEPRSKGDEEAGDERAGRLYVRSLLLACEDAHSLTSWTTALSAMGVTQPPDDGAWSGLSADLPGTPLQAEPGAMSAYQQRLFGGGAPLPSPISLTAGLAAASANSSVAGTPESSLELARRASASPLAGEGSASRRAPRGFGGSAGRALGLGGSRVSKMTPRVAVQTIRARLRLSKMTPHLGRPLRRRTLEAYPPAVATAVAVPAGAVPADFGGYVVGNGGVGSSASASSSSRDFGGFGGGGSGGGSANTSPSVSMCPSPRCGSALPSSMRSTEARVVPPLAAHLDGAQHEHTPRHFGGLDKQLDNGWSSASQRTSHGSTDMASTPPGGGGSSASPRPPHGRLRTIRSVGANMDDDAVSHWSDSGRDSLRQETARPPLVSTRNSSDRMSLGGGVDRDQQVRMSAVGHEFTRLCFSARTVQARAELATVLDFAQMVWSLIVSKRDLATPESERVTRPVLDKALEVLYEQATAWLARSQLAHSLALHVALERAQQTGGMTLWMRGLQGEKLSASFSDEVSLLELLADAFEIRGTIRLQRRAEMQRRTEMQSATGADKLARA